MEVFELSQAELRRIMVAGTHLHKWQARGPTGLAHVIHEQGQVQLDPLNPAGRYHDLFFLARMPDYKVGQFEREAYSKQLVFESFGVHGHIWGALCAISIEQFPLFHPQMRLDLLGRYQRPRIEKLQQEHPGLMEQVEAHIQNNGLTRSEDLAELGKASEDVAFWKTSRLGATAMEALWLLGRLGVARREGQFRKVYDAIENCVPKKYQKDPRLTEDEKARQAIDLKLQSMPLVPVGPISTNSKRKKSRHFDPAWFSDSDLRPDRKPPVILKQKGGKSGYIAPAHWRQLKTARTDEELRAIGPLDPLIWNRQTTQRIFDFEYLWEVYHKPEKRRWGYYVYPLLYKGKLIGRLEAKLNKKTKVLSFFNFQAEPGFPEGNQVESACLRLIDRWARALETTSVEFDGTLGHFGITSGAVKLT